MVDSNSQDDADERLAPILAAMADFDPQAEMRQALSAELSSVEWLSRATLADAGPLDGDGLETLLESSEASAVLVFSMSSNLSPDFDKLLMSCETTLLPVSGELLELAGGSPSSPKPLYRGQLVYRERLEGGAPDGQTLTAVIRDGMKEIARMFVYDVEQAVEREEGEDFKFDGLACTMALNNGARYWARVKKGGELYSVSPLGL